MCREKNDMTSRYITRSNRHTFHRSSPPPLFSIFFKCITCNTGENAGLSCDPFIRNMAEMALGVSDMILRRLECNDDNTSTYCVLLFLCYRIDDDGGAKLNNVSVKPFSRVNFV